VASQIERITRIVSQIKQKSPSKVAQQRRPTPFVGPAPFGPTPNLHHSFNHQKNIASLDSNQERIPHQNGFERSFESSFKPQSTGHGLQRIDLNLGWIEVASHSSTRNEFWCGNLRRLWRSRFWSPLWSYQL